MITQEYSLEKSEQLYGVLNRKHFLEGHLLNDMAMLLSSLEEIGGVDVAQCEAFLQSSVGEEAVLRTVDLVHSMGTRHIQLVIHSVSQPVSYLHAYMTYCMF
jgi:predicted DsbA family dithiol-disulfide isomerase